MNDTNQLYQDSIKQFSQRDYGHGKLASATGEATLVNSLCGDRVQMQVAVISNRITAVAQHTKGCLLCRAAASLIGLRTGGLDTKEILSIADALEKMLTNGAPSPRYWPELQMFEPARPFISRHRCILLPFHTLVSAIDISASIK